MTDRLHGFHETLQAVVFLLIYCHCEYIVIAKLAKVKVASGLDTRIEALLTMTIDHAGCGNLNR